MFGADPDPPASVVTAKPNVILIYADDLGYGDVGCYGATKVKTPNIDRLAREGRRFTDAHSASAVCTPSRYALLTGEYPFRKGLTVPVFLRSGLVVDPDRVTIADVMKQAGYRTACIGKWHLGFGSESPDWNQDLKPGPLELGFDYYFGVPVVSSHPPFVYVENHRVVGLRADDPLVYGKTAETAVLPEKMGLTQIGGATAAHAQYKDSMVGTRLTQKSVEFIKNHQREPFFLYLATTNIHHPFTPHPRFVGTSECGPYGDFVHELDWMVGEILRTLDDTGLARNTLVIFTSDNGGMINLGGQEAIRRGHRINGNLLGFKFEAWEGGHRVPFIVRWPAQLKPGSTSDQLICSVDLLATLAALTEAKLTAADGPDSFNILPALIGTPKSPIRTQAIFAANSPTHLAMRQDRWVYIGAAGGGGFKGTKVGEHALGGPAALQFAGQLNSDVENGALKPDAPNEQLYDLEKDPTQSHNVARQHPDLVARLAALLQEHRANPRSAPAP
jgi:arylsulfatase A